MAVVMAAVAMAAAMEVAAVVMVVAVAVVVVAVGITTATRNMEANAIDLGRKREKKCSVCETLDRTVVFYNYIGLSLTRTD